MEKKNIDWANLGFGYMPTDYRFVAHYKNGAWDEGELTTESNVTINECAGVFQYAQTCFEGLKAYTTEDGKIVCFRPDLNAARMADSCRRLEMPVFPEDKFVEAVIKTVKANAAWVPPFGSGATLYIRPYMFGSNAVIGVKPAEEYEFRILVTPVGPYFKGGAKPIVIRVTDFDRAAPHGTGHIKAGLNYAMSLHAIVDAHKEGYAENMYLDAATRTYVEETGGANFIFITKDGKLVTPKSDSILPSITRRSLCYVAKEMLGMEVEERKVPLTEVSEFAEAGLCGTAAVISPIGRIDDHGKTINIPAGMDEMGPVTKKLYETLVGIQQGKIAGPEGWVKVIEG
ncbi:MAG: branched-chain amino acid aminotransferase [Lachnospiraceae bacterium]|nr:branched-chain amino acid aminotransferase [Lachnospiraceae bacterium]